MGFAGVGGTIGFHSFCQVCSFAPTNGKKSGGEAKKKWKTEEKRNRGKMKTMQRGENVTEKKKIERKRKYIRQGRRSGPGPTERGLYFFFHLSLHFQFFFCLNVLFYFFKINFFLKKKVLYFPSPALLMASGHAAAAAAAVVVVVVVVVAVVVAVVAVAAVVASIETQ